MKTLTVWNTEAETSRTINVEEEFFDFVERRFKRMGFLGDSSEISERMYADFKKSFETLHSAKYAKFLKDFERIFKK